MGKGWMKGKVGPQTGILSQPAGYVIVIVSSLSVHTDHCPLSEPQNNTKTASHLYHSYWCCAAVSSVSLEE